MFEKIINNLYSGAGIRKLLAYHIAREVVNDLSNDREITESDLDSILKVRDDLNKRMIAVSVILVITLLSISIVLFTEQDEDNTNIALFGIKNLSQNEAAFVGFVIGNLLFVITFGTFWKQLVMEYIILNICESRSLPLGRKYISFKYTPARYIFYTFGFYGRKLDVSQRYKALVVFVSIYTTVGVFALYCCFYFYVLVFFLAKIIGQGHLFYAFTLTVLNILGSALPIITFAMRKQIFPDIDEGDAGI